MSGLPAEKIGFVCMMLRRTGVMLATHPASEQSDRKRYRLYQSRPERIRASSTSPWSTPTPAGTRSTSDK